MKNNFSSKDNKILEIAKNGVNEYNKQLFYQRPLIAGTFTLDNRDYHIYLAITLKDEELKCKEQGWSVYYPDGYNAIITLVDINGVKQIHDIQKETLKRMRLLLKEAKEKIENEFLYGKNKSYHHAYRGLLNYLDFHTMDMEEVKE